MGDLYQCLREQEENQAQELATAMELYVTGSLSYLNHRTNVDIHNRVVCFDISGLGQNLKKPGMLTVQNKIWMRPLSTATQARPREFTWMSFTCS